ncbi:MAG: amidohydrolase family protein [Holophagales bacterium]|nr:amidohydrolase family protein [Holophagales bacterium]
MRTLLIENALVAGMRSADDLHPSGAVWAEEGIIRALGSEARAAAAAAGARGEPVERVDAEGLWLFPGFVQTHIHLCQTLLRNGPDDLPLLPWLKTHVWPGEAAHDEETLFLSARLGLAELAAGGTTAILDMGTVRHTDAVFRAAEASGLRVTSGNALMDDPSTNPPGLFAETEEALAEGERLFARWHGTAGGRLRFAWCPRFAVSCTDRILRESASRARAQGVLVHTHASENRDEVELVRARSGRANIEHLRDLGIAGPATVLAHVIHTNEEERQLLAADGTAVAHCPSSNLKLASGICPVPDYLARGIRVTLGADGAPCNDRLDPFSEMRHAALLQKVASGPAALTAWQVARMATAEGAAALGLGDVCGTIEVGKRADFVLLDPSAGFARPTSWRDDPYGPLVFAFDRGNVVETRVDGEVVFHRDRRPGRGLAPTASEIEAAAGRLRERIAKNGRREPSPPLEGRA